MSAAETVIFVVNYSLVLLYGLLISIELSGGISTSKEKKRVALSYFVMEALQIVLGLALGVEATRKLYPFIIHLPLLIIMAVLLKKDWVVSSVSILTAYFCCQIPRFTALFCSWILGEKTYICTYTIAIVASYILLQKYFCKTAHEAMTYSRNSLLIFGAVPLTYYIFDYSVTVYTDMLYSNIQALSEFMPVVLATFYVLFIIVYHRETQQQSQTELENSLLEIELKQSAGEIEALKANQEMNAIFRHDMRHHAAIISAYLEAGDSAKALDYINQSLKGMDQLRIRYYCENKAANLIISAFAQKAEKAGINLNVSAALPQEISIPDNEICAILSNGLENAVNAASRCADIRFVSLNCKLNRDRLLIEIQNNYIGEVAMKDGIPCSSEQGHGFGAKSIKTITELRGGISSFEAQNGTFTLRVMVPLM